MKVVLFSVAVCVIHSLLTSSKIAEGRLLKGPSFCSLKSDEGPCRGYFQNWYYHESSGECKTFIYGGCPGNKNRFETKEECEKTCKVKDKMAKHSKDSNSHKSSLDMRTFWDHHRNKLFIKKWLTRKRRGVAQNRLPKQNGLELNPEGSQGSQNDPIENMLNNAMTKHDPDAPGVRDPEEGGKQDIELQRRKKVSMNNQPLKSVKNSKATVRASKKRNQMGQMPSADKEGSTGGRQTMSSATSQRTGQRTGQRKTENRKPASNHNTNVGNNRQLAKGKKQKTTDVSGTNLGKDIENVQRINDNVRNQGNGLPVKNTKTTDDNGTRPNGINQNIPNLNGNENVNRQSKGGENQNPAKHRPFDPKKKKGNTTQLSQTQPNSNKTITKVNNPDLTSVPTTKPSPVITPTDKKKVSPTPTISATVRKKENSINENVKQTVVDSPLSNKVSVTQGHIKPTLTITTVNQNSREATKRIQTTTVPTTTRVKKPEDNGGQDEGVATATPTPSKKPEEGEGTNQRQTSNKGKGNQSLSTTEGPLQSNETNPAQGSSQQVNKTKLVQGPSQEVNIKKVKTMQPTTTASPSQTKKPEPSKGSGQGADKKKEENNQATTAASPVPSKKTKEPTEEPEEDQQTSNHGGNEDNGNPANQQILNHGKNEDNGNPATNEDASSDVNRIPSDKSGNRAGPRLRIRPVGDEEVHTSSHFAAFFLSSIVAVFAVYFIYHNRQKIVAIVIEGRSVSPRRGAGYRKLETNVEEAMPTMKKYVA